MSTIITHVDPGSPAAGRVRPGEKLLTINGSAIADVLDYRYYSYDSRLTLELGTADGMTKKVKIRKDEGEDLGLDFESYLMDKPQACANRCIFCFVDQLPPGMRQSLYFKDDDARLSFLTGSYITLTNLSDRELERIIDLRISPINVSVHATDPELRAFMLGNPAGARGMQLLQRLSDGGIAMNCQIVCCPGINDGEALKKTMSDLAGLYPQVGSVSIVPLGMTKHRERLTRLTAYNSELANETIRIADAFGDECLKKHGSRIFFCADELFLKAGLEIPDDEYYEDYPQIENGVGMLRLLETEFIGVLDSADPSAGDAVPFAMATGVAAGKFLKKMLLTAQKKCDNIIGEVCPIVNDFFGHTIDVAGLVTGGDLIAQLRGRTLGERLLIPSNMLRQGEGVFLDDVTAEEVERELGLPVKIVPQGGEGLLRAMLGQFD